MALYLISYDINHKNENEGNAIRLPRYALAVRQKYKLRPKDLLTLLLVVQFEIQEGWQPKAAVWETNAHAETQSQDSQMAQHHSSYRSL